MDFPDWLFFVNIVLRHILENNIFYFQTLNPVWNEEFVFRVSKLL